MNYFSQEYYRCIVNDFANENENEKIFNIFGRHLRNRDDTMVDSLVFEHQWMKFLPTNINKKFPKIKRIDVIYTRLNVIKGENFDGLKLEVLNLGYNHINDVKENSFKEQNLLVEILLNHNQIESLPENLFNETTKLEILNLDNNKLKTLNENLLKNLVNLRKIYLKGNLIHGLPTETFQSNKNLKFMDLSNNKINCPITVTPDHLKESLKLSFLPHCANETC